MRKLTITILISCLTVLSSSAQEQRTTELHVGIQGGVSLVEGEIGSNIGAFVKGLFPTGNSGNYLTGAISYDRVVEKSRYSGEKFVYPFVNFTGGYRITFNTIYLEPQLGAGFWSEEGYNEFATHIGVEPGFQFDKFSVSLNYRMLSDGLIFGETYHLFSIRAGIALF
jgi:hypothetical protein